MSYLITELSPHIPLLAVTTLALVFVVNPVWFSATVTLTYYLFDFFGLASSPTNTYPSPSPRSYSLHCSKQLTTLLRLAYVLFMVTVRVRVGSQDSRLDNSNNTNLLLVNGYLGLR
jgi:hypothetical protein